MSTGEQFARFAKDLARAAVGLDSLAEAANLRVARGAAEDARAVAPVLTGKLSGSIRVVRRKDGSVAVESSEFYSAFQEFGTSTMAPNPFIRPAVDKWGPRLVDEVEGIRDEVVKRLGG